MSNPETNIGVPLSLDIRKLTEEESSSAARVEQVLRNQEDRFSREIVKWGVEMSEDNPAEGVNYLIWRVKPDDTNLPDTSELKVDLFTDDEKADSAVLAALAGRTGIVYGPAIIGKKRQIILLSRPGERSRVAPAVQAPASGSDAPIGSNIGGAKITHYGYAGDSTPDTNSMKGIGDRGNRLQAGMSVALTKSMRAKLFGTSGHSTGRTFQWGGRTYRDDDTAQESDLRIDVYDPGYQGIDQGISAARVAENRALMAGAGVNASAAPAAKKV